MDPRIHLIATRSISANPVKKETVPFELTSDSMSINIFSTHIPDLPLPMYPSEVGVCEGCEGCEGFFQSKIQKNINISNGAQQNWKKTYPTLSTPAFKWLTDLS